MLASKSQNEWCDEAKASEYFIIKYGFDSVKMNEEGYTDSVSGCTITIYVYIQKRTNSFWCHIT